MIDIKKYVDWKTITMGIIFLVVEKSLKGDMSMMFDEKEKNIEYVIMKEMMENTNYLDERIKNLEKIILAGKGS